VRGESDVVDLNELAKSKEGQETDFFTDLRINLLRDDSRGIYWAAVVLDVHVFII
jgi:hypothetical protein